MSFKNIKKINPGDYPVTFKIIDGFLIMASFEFGISIQKKFNVLKKAEEIGNLYLDLVEKIDKEIKNRLKNKFEIPEARTLKKTLKIDTVKEEKKYIPLKKVSKMLGVSVDTVRRMADENEIKCKKTRGGHRRFLESSVLKYIEKNEENSD